MRVSFVPLRAAVFSTAEQRIQLSHAHGVGRRSRLSSAHSLPPLPRVEDWVELLTTPRPLPSRGADPRTSYDCSPSSLTSPPPSCSSSPPTVCVSLHSVDDLRWMAQCWKEGALHARVEQLIHYCVDTAAAAVPSEPELPPKLPWPMDTTHRFLSTSRDEGLAAGTGPVTEEANSAQPRRALPSLSSSLSQLLAVWSCHVALAMLTQQTSKDGVAHSLSDESSGSRVLRESAVLHVLHQWLEKEVLPLYESFLAPGDTAASLVSTPSAASDAHLWLVLPSCEVWASLHTVLYTLAVNLTPTRTGEGSHKDTTGSSSRLLAMALLNASAEVETALNACSSSSSSSSTTHSQRTHIVKAQRRWMELQTPKEEQNGVSSGVNERSGAAASLAHVLNSFFVRISSAKSSGRMSTRGQLHASDTGSSLFSSNTVRSVVHPFEVHDGLSHPTEEDECTVEAMNEQLNRIARAEKPAPSVA